VFIFIDESGDLGCDFSKKGTSKKFTIAMLVCYTNDIQHHIIKAVKKTLRRKLNHGRKQNSIHELKGSSTTLQIKEYFLALMPQSGWDLYSITADKEKLKYFLEKKNGKNKIYNFLTRELLKTFTPLTHLTHVSVIVDASKNGNDRKDFNTYIKTHLEITLGLEVDIYISHENSQNNAGLQAIDLFCWGIQRNNNLGKSDWFDSFEHKIVKSIYYTGVNTPTIE
jgi:hypothetical protein